MKNREPFDIQQYVFVYNLYQVILNIWTVVEMIRSVYEPLVWTKAWILALGTLCATGLQGLSHKLPCVGPL